MFRWKSGTGESPVASGTEDGGSSVAWLSEDFDRMYRNFRRPSVAPEKLLRALLLQVLYTIRSERMLMEQLAYNLLFRWFVGWNVDDVVWVPTVLSKNRDRLLEGEVAQTFFVQVLQRARGAGLIAVIERHQQSTNAVETVASPGIEEAAA